MKKTSLGDIYITPQEVTDEMIEAIANGPIVTKVKGKAEINIHETPSCFDIEATNIPSIQQAVMYVWQWRLDDLTIVGRTWDEFKTLFNRIEKAFKETKLFIYVHNLSYEFAFLSGILPFKTSDVFATAAHKVLYCTVGNIEFRCSYLLTNMSLALFTKSFHVKHQKQDGDEFDYKEQRFPWTKLNPLQMAYCVNDVVGLQEGLQALMARDSDTLATIPLTSTGYVRREVKKAMYASGEAIKLQWRSKEKAEAGEKHVQKKIPDFETYKMLRAAFRGGNTHANRYYATGVSEDDEGLTIYNVKSFDRSSSYPDVMVNCKFPVGNWFTPFNCNLDECLNLTLRDYAYVCEIYIYNPRLKNRYEPVPYIPVSKCSVLEYDKHTDRDNGRVLRAKYLEITVTDIDLKIILDQYDYDYIEVAKIRACKYGYLPEPIRELVRKYYKAKTELKGDTENELLYAKSKALLNAIYGMTVQDPCKELFEFDGLDGFERAEPQEAKDIRELMDKTKDDEEYKKLSEKLNKILEAFYEETYESNIKWAFLSYGYGVWVSALARLRLQEAINLCSIGKCGSCCVYVDTDSVKFVGEVDFTEYNKQRIEDSIKNGAFAVDSKGKTHYMGVFEEEPDNFGREFRTMGAKKYAYRGIPLKDTMPADEWAKWERWAVAHGYSTDGIDLHITIAGVSKIGGAIEMWNKGGLECFRSGFTFIDAGGTASKYNGVEDCKDLCYTEGEHSVEITPNVYIEDSEYTLGLEGDYDKMLAAIDELCSDYIRKVRAGI